MGQEPSPMRASDGGSKEGKLRSSSKTNSLAEGKNIDTSSSKIAGVAGAGMLGVIVEEKIPCKHNSDEFLVEATGKKKKEKKTGHLNSHSSSSWSKYRKMVE